MAKAALEEGFTEIFAWNDMFEKSSIEIMKEVRKSISYLRLESLSPLFPILRIQIIID